MDLIWSPDAMEDLISVAHYIKYDLSNPSASKQFVDSIIEKAELFAEMPISGTVLYALNGLDTGYRYMVSGNWMVFFRCEENRAVVVRVLYAKSDYMRKLFND